jgi:hypothetical protein
VTRQWATDAVVPELHRQDSIHAIDRFAARDRGVFDVLWLLLIDTGDIVCSSV